MITIPDGMGLEEYGLLGRAKGRPVRRIKRLRYAEKAPPGFVTSEAAAGKKLRMEMRERPAPPEEEYYEVDPEAPEWGEEEPEVEVVSSNQVRPRRALFRGARPIGKRIVVETPVEVTEEAEVFPDETVFKAETEEIEEGAEYVFPQMMPLPELEIPRRRRAAIPSEEAYPEEAERQTEEYRAAQEKAEREGTFEDHLRISDHLSLDDLSQGRGLAIRRRRHGPLWRARAAREAADFERSFSRSIAARYGRPGLGQEGAGGLGTTETILLVAGGGLLLVTLGILLTR